MESYRVYKSLPLDDFMNNVQFIVAKCGLLITPIIQDINYLKHNDLHSEHYWKQLFMNKVQNMLIKEKDNLNCDIDVTDMGSFGYWTFIPRRKEKHTISDKSVQEMFEHYIYRKRDNQMHPSDSQESLWAAGECQEAEKWLEQFGVNLDYDRIQPMVDGKTPVKAFE